MVDTVNISRQMERNANLGISDFYLVEDGEGKLDWTGTMDLCRVLEIVRKKAFEQKSCDLSAWVHVKPLPSLPAALALAHHHMMMPSNDVVPSYDDVPSYDEVPSHDQIPLSK